MALCYKVVADAEAAAEQARYLPLSVLTANVNSRILLLAFIVYQDTATRAGALVAWALTAWSPWTGRLGALK